MGADHVSTLHRQASGAAVTMVADVHLARVQAIADGTPGVRATDDGFALIADPEVDAVVIASPDPTHVMPAVAAVNAGKPVLCEKALAPTVAECPQVVPAILAPAVPNAENPFPATHPSRSQVMPGFPASLPASRVPDSQDAPPLRWGIIGPGWIAERFTASVQRHTRQQIVAVGSRNADRSAQFAARHGIERSHGSYEELVADPGVDVVYVATPHNGHYPCARLALEAGKHTLVEKPIGLNAAQAAEIAALATSQGVFCMEALWTFFLPKFDVIRQLLADGVLGQVRTVNADHGEHFTADHRIMRPELAGGPLLDLGTYPVSFATWVLGPPVNVLANGQPHPAGVNGQASAILSDHHGNQAVLHTTILSNTPTTGVIAGSAGTLTIPGPFYQPGGFAVTPFTGATPLRYSEPPTAHDALHFEAAEVARCIAEGRAESPLRTLADSVVTLRVIDDIRRQLGIIFDEER